MKRCFKCGDEKPIDEFYKHPRMKDGLLGKCKECTKQDVRKNRAENIERYREFDRKRANLPHRIAARKAYSKTDACKASHSKSVKKYKANNKEMYLARMKFGNAIRGGKIERHPCIACGDDAQGHHYDYSRPLDVVWLCPKHHAEVHRMKREAERAA